MAGAEYRRKAALAALDLAAAVADVPVGVAANAGIAFVGNVGSGTVMDFTALGDVVNVGARLQSQASPDEVVLSSELYSLVAAEHPGARFERVEVGGVAFRWRSREVSGGLSGRVGVGWLCCAVNS
jgi:class 3 adenylate cyclase